jgi:zinc/manganese transport system ATP-binding protein
VEDLTVRQGTQIALSHISLNLPEGSSTALVGPNGAGKSTLVQAMLGLIPIESGSVHLFGHSLEQLGDLRHAIGYVPQNLPFDRTFPITVAEFVALGIPKRSWWKLDNRKQDKTAVERALVRVNAKHLAHKPLGNLSGGETKLVLLAYCLVHPRKLLILDEAPAGLDPQAEESFYQLLEELRMQEGWTILQVSHDLDMVSRSCDRVVCINQRVVCQGTPEEALSDESLLLAYGPNRTRYHHQH